jgi:hypothetical protein
MGRLSPADAAIQHDLREALAKALSHLSLTDRDALLRADHDTTSGSVTAAAWR